MSWDSNIIDFESSEERWGLLLITWGIAAVATTFPEIPLVLLFFLFPSGLAYMLTGREGGIAALVFGWLVYLTINITILVTKKRLVFYGLYIVFFVMLIYNVQGCRRILSHIE